MKNIAIFISGSGSNAGQIMRFFEKSDVARVAVVLSSRADAYGLVRAREFGVPAVSFSRDEFYNQDVVRDILAKYEIDFVVLAGFMWFVPKYITDTYPDRIVNIHPALLPKYGGKGMYGDNVHRAVIEAGEAESGITIHKVNEVYDSGDIIFQASVAVAPDDTPESLAAKIHTLEHTHYPQIIEQEILKLK